MGARSIGSVMLTFGLVSIPTKIFTATSPQAVSFNMLHKGCGGRLGQLLRCKADLKLVERADTERGFEYAPDQYVKFTDEEIKALEADRADTLEIVEFVPASSVDPLHIEKTQYLGTDKGGDRAYRLLSLAMSLEGRVGLGRWKTRGKDTLVVVRPYQDGLVLHQVFYATEVRNFAEVPHAENMTVHKDELVLARKLVAQLAKPRFEPERFHDTWAVRIKQAVEAKVAGEDFVAPPETQRAQVIDLMEALRRSVVPVNSGEPASSPGPKKTAAPRSKVGRTRRAG